MLKNFALILLVFSLSSCTLFKSSPQKKFDQAQKTEQKAKNAIVEKEVEIQDRGKSFIFGAKYANEFETNRTPSITLSHDFLDLATLTIGNPNVEDAKIIQEITDNLLNKAQKDLAFAIADKNKAEKDLKAFINQTSNLQKEKDELTGIYEQKLIASGKLNEQNASKANEYDIDHSFINTINPFHGFLSMIKKLFVWGLIIGLLVIGFHILETIFPELHIVSVIFGGIVKVLVKFFPKLKASAGLVSSQVYSTLKMTVKGIGDVFDTLKNRPIEQDLISSFNDNYMFTKKEVLALLEKHSCQIEELLKNELNDHQDSTAKAIVTVAKSEVGLSQPVVPGLRLI